MMRCQGRIQEFPKGGLRPAIRNAKGGLPLQVRYKKRGGGGGVLSALGPTRKAGGGGGCCPLQARYEKRTRGGGGGVMAVRRFRPDTKSGEGWEGGGGGGLFSR